MLPLIEWPQSQGELKQGSGKALFLLFATQIGAITILLPIIAAGAIAGERERGTYDLLFTTPLPARSIVLAKTAAPMLFVLLGLVATAPPVSALYLLGGVSFDAVLKCYAITAMTVVVTCLVSLVQSAKAKSSLQAAMLGLTWSALWSSGPFIVLGLVAWSILKAYRELLFFDSKRGIPQNALVRAVNHVADSWARFIFLGSALLAGLAFALPPVLILLSIGPVACALSPYSAVHLSLLPQKWGEGGAWFLYLCVSGVIALSHFVKLARAAGQPESDPSSPFLAPTELWQSTPEVDHEFKARIPQAAPAPNPWTSISPRSFSVDAVIGWGDRDVRLFSNPVLVQELRTQFHGSALYRQTVFWSTALVCLFAGLASPSPNVLFLMASVLGLLLLPAAGAACFAREMESGNLDLLRGTALTGREILHGKLHAALLSAGSAAAAVAWIVAAGAFFHSPGFRESWAATTLDLLMRLAAITSSFVFLAILSTLCSTVTRRSLHGILLAYAVAFALQAGTGFFGYLILQNSTDLGGSSTTQVLVLGLLSPFLTFDQVTSWRPSGLAPDAWKPIFFLLANVGLSVGLYWASVRRAEHVLRHG